MAEHRLRQAAKSISIILLAGALLAACGQPKEDDDMSSTGSASTQSTVSTAQSAPPPSSYAGEDPVCNFVIRGQDETLGTWVWDAMAIVRQRQQVLDFLDKNNVSEIYISLHRGISKDKYRAFLKDAAALGIRTALIGAEAEWVLPDEKGYDAWLDWLREYQDGCTDPTEKFYSMHMDVEPHQLPLWLEDQQYVVDCYAQWVKRARADCDELGIELELDIPVWFDPFLYNDGGTEVQLDEYCFQNADTVLYMAYRNSGAGIYTAAQRGLMLAEKYGKKLIIASETGNTMESEPEITFYPLGSIKLYEGMATLRDLVRENHPDTQVGFAIHYFYSWSNLPPLGNPWP